MKARVPIPPLARKLLLSIVLLLVLFVAAGVAYTFFMDRTVSEPPAASKQVAEPADAAIKPTPPAANAAEGVAIDALVSPVPAGANASLSVSTNAGSRCTIAVIYNGVPAKDSGLVSKTADAYGGVSWSWTIPAGTPVGVWPVTVTCTYHGRSGVGIGNLSVTK